MKRVLILGSSGMLGHVAMIRLEELGYSVFGVSNARKFGGISTLLDVSSKKDLDLFLDKNDFDVIVNCIALLVSDSEEYKDLAVYLNSFIPHFLETKYMETNTKIIHVSTDGVFSGKGAPYSENSPHDTESFYGRSKSLGEIVNAKDLTVRSAFWGPDLNEASTSFFNWILNQNDTIKGFSNHIFNGVSSLEFAGFVDTAIRDNLKGIFHLTANIPISKCDFMLSVREVFGLKNAIIPVEAQSVNRTLMNNRSDIPYAEADYATMLLTCKKWIQERKMFYPHYEIA